MTTRAETPDEQARRIVEHELESIGFDLDANTRETTLSLERRLALLQQQKNMRRLYRMMGGEPAPMKERAAQ